MMQLPCNTWKRRFITFIWQPLIAPLHKIEDADLRRFAIRIAIMLACTIVATSFLVVITRLGVTIFSIIHDLMPILTLYFALLFVLNLRGWHFMVSRIAVFSMELVIIGIWLNNIEMSAVLVLNYLILVVFVSSRLLPLREVVFQALINCAAIAILIFAVPRAEYLAETLLFNVVFSSAVILVTASRQRDIERVKESEGRYRNLMDANFEPVAVLDLHGNILDVNLAFENLSGFAMKDLRGRSIATLLTPESAKSVMMNFGKLGTEMLRANAINAEGRVIPIETHSRRTIYKETPALTVIVRNLDVLSAMEQEKREYELRYKAIFENTNDGVYIIDLEGNYLVSNPRGWQMVGVSKDEILTARVADYVIPEERADSLNVIQRLLNNEAVPEYIRKFRRKNGEIFYGEIFAMLVRDHEGKPIYIQSIVRDITERKRAEESRLALTVQQERNALLRQLIDDFSHYVRTPLANIKNSSYIITKVADAERQKLHGDIIDGEIQRLVTLLDDLLTLARIEPESEKEAVLACELVALVRNIVPSPVGSGMEDNDHTWTFHTSETSLQVYGNAIRLLDVFQRLTQNARHYTPKGGTIDITIRAHPEQNAACVSVEDSGIGIAPEALAHIFETFYRSDHARSMNPVSSGLGLSICQRIVEIHRGVIHVTSTVGEGSRFDVWLTLDLTTVLTYDLLGLPPLKQGETV